MFIKSVRLSMTNAATRKLHRAIRGDKWKENILSAKSAPKHSMQPDILKLRYLDPFRQIHAEESVIEMILSVAAAVLRDALHCYPLQCVLQERCHLRYHSKLASICLCLPT